MADDLDASESTDAPETKNALLVVASRTHARWVAGRLRVGTERGAPIIETPDLFALTLLHAFATPTDPRAVIHRFPGADPGMVRQAVADFRQAGFLVPVPSSEAGEEEASALPARQDPAPSARRRRVAGSVIMPTYNKAPYLDLTLASYRSQTTDDFEIILIDDGSSDDTPEVAAAYEADLSIRYLRRPHAGRAGARNAGIREAVGDILLFSDDDRLVSPAFVAEHLAAHERPGDTLVLGWMYGVVTMLHPALVGPLFTALSRRVAPAAVSPDGLAALTTSDAVTHRFNQTIAELATVDPDWERKVEPAVSAFGDGLAGLQVPWFLGSTGNLSAPRHLVAAVDAFDPGYTGYGMEDTDLCYALCRAGASCIIARRAANYHQLHPKPNLANEMATSLRYFCRKYDDLAAWLFARWFLGGIDLPTANTIVQASSRRGEPDAVQQALVTLLREQVGATVG